MKICTRCGDKDTKFSKRAASKDGFKSRCKNCDKLYSKGYKSTRKQETKKCRRKKIYERLKEYLADKSCVGCSERDFVVLEFDHRDRATKEFEISAGVGRGFSWSRLLPELEKCDVMCANCHRRKTAEELGWYK